MDLVAKRSVGWKIQMPGWKEHKVTTRKAFLHEKLAERAQIGR